MVTIKKSLMYGTVWIESACRNVFTDIRLLILSFLLMIAAITLICVYVPTEEQMGVTQRIFYFHVPLAWVAFLAFFVVFVLSILYIWKRDEKWDHWAVSSAEIGVMFTSLVLITGSFWAKLVWDVWWTWDFRLTTTLVLWFIYAAYLLVRSFTDEEERGARFAAVVGIVGFIDVPVVALAIRYGRTLHPDAVVFEGGLEPSMILTLIISLAAFTVLYVVLLRQRTTFKGLKSEMLKIRRMLED